MPDPQASVGESRCLSSACRFFPAYTERLLHKEQIPWEDLRQGLRAAFLGSNLLLNGQEAEMFYLLMPNCLFFVFGSHPKDRVGLLLTLAQGFLLAQGPYGLPGSECRSVMSTVSALPAVL